MHKLARARAPCMLVMSHVLSWQETELLHCAVEPLDLFFYFLFFFIRQKIKRADVGGCRRPVAAPPVAPRGRGMPTHATCQARPLERLGVAQVSGCEHRFARNQRHRFLFDRQHPPCRGRGGDFRSMPAVEKLRTCSMQPGVEMLLFKFRRRIVDGKPQFVSRGPQNHDISI